MSKFILAFQNNLNNDTGNSNPGNNQDDNNEQNIPEGAIQVTGFTGDYEKYNGIYLQKDSGYDDDPDLYYPYHYEHEEKICELTWSPGFSYWHFMTTTDYQELAFCEGTIIGDKPKHPSNYSYRVNPGINSNNPTVK